MRGRAGCARAKATIDAWLLRACRASRTSAGRPSPRIEIGVRRDGGEPVFYVRDNGAGIEARFLEKVFELFPRLKERATQLGGSLSGGEQQMLAIGRGLMAAPRLLLLDEPSLGLAPIVVAQIFETLQMLNKERGIAILLVEQNMKMALKVSNYGYIMQLGQVMVSGTSEELRENRKVYESYMGSA